MSVCSRSNKPQTMATLQKLKFLALHCGPVQSPTRSPRRSPLIHLRRRKPSLLMLLSRSGSRRSSRGREPPAPVEAPPERRNSLKDLFVSSPPFEGYEKIEKRRGEFGAVVVGGGVGPGSPRPGWTGFRCKSLLRRAWRPVLVTIPE